jgi:hypothetical protein
MAVVQRAAVQDVQQRFGVIAQRLPQRIGMTEDQTGVLKQIRETVCQRVQVVSVVFRQGQRLLQGCVQRPAVGDPGTVDVGTAHQSTSP